MSCGQRGSKHHKSKLSEQAVREIRRLYKNSEITYAELGHCYGVTHTTIGVIIRGTGWRHVK